MQGKTNFFEKRVAEYAKSGVGVDASEQVFDLGADFSYFGREIPSVPCNLTVCKSTDMCTLNI